MFFKLITTYWIIFSKLIHFLNDEKMQSLPAPKTPTNKYVSSFLLVSHVSLSSCLPPTPHLLPTWPKWGWAGLVTTVLGKGPCQKLAVGPSSGVYFSILVDPKQICSCQQLLALLTLKSATWVEINEIC